VEFRWNAWNVDHIARHGIDPEDAEAVVEDATPPFPKRAPDDKWLVWGQATNGALIQVVFVLDEDDTVFVIHARPLTERERARYRRWKE
jgi:uncharacterized DUF497 family protein